MLTCLCACAAVLRLCHVSLCHMFTLIAQCQLVNLRPAVMEDLSNILRTELDDLEWLMQQMQALSSSSSRCSVITTDDLQQLQEQQEELELGLWKAVRAVQTWSDINAQTAADLLKEARREIKPAVGQQLNNK
jgi:hypothetical protein